MKVSLRTREVEVRSLSFAEVERFQADGTFDKLPTLETAKLGAMVKDARDAMMVVALAAVRHAHPDMTREILADELDLANVKRLWAAVMGESGLVSEGGSGEAVPQTR